MTDHTGDGSRWEDERDTRGGMTDHTPQPAEQPTTPRGCPCQNWCGLWEQSTNGHHPNCDGYGNNRLFKEHAKSAAAPAVQPDSGTYEDSDYRLLADTIIGLTNPPDDDVAEVSIVMDAVMRLAVVVRALPCTCPAPEMGDDLCMSDACARCQALGRFGDKEVVR